MAGILVGLALERLPARNHLVLAVAIVLADAADADGSNIFPSVARVARLARCSERAVQTSLQELQAQGYLELVERGGGRGRPARYRIDRAWLEAQPSLVGGNGAGGAPFAETVHGAPERAQKGCTKGAPACAPNPIPVDPIPTTRARTHAREAAGDGGGGGGGGVADLVEAALWAAGQAGTLRSPPALARHVKQRIVAAGPTAEDLEALARWRAAQAAAAAAEEKRAASVASAAPPRRAASRAQLAALARAIGR